MRCSRCGFENMPRVATCFRCGSALDAGQIKIDVHPPRVARWRKPIRRLQLRIRRFFPRRRDPDDVRAAGRQGELTEAAWVLGYFLLSLLPGLAHVHQGRFAQVRVWLLAWFALLVTGAFLYGMPIGIFFFGLAVGLHAWIMLDGARLMKPGGKLWQRAGGLMLVGLAILSLYRGIGSLVLRDVTGGYISFAVPWQNVQRGDYLLARPLAARDRPLARGDLVLVAGAIIGMGARGNTYARGAQETVGEIIGLPGETVIVTNGVFSVGGTMLDRERYPMPQWLSARGLATPLGPRTYFVALEYQVRAAEATATDDAIRRVCVEEEQAIRARAFMRWLPVWRRGWLKESP